MANEMFRHYDNPLQASIIWRTYARDLRRFGCLLPGDLLRKYCTRAEILDLELNRLIESVEMKFRGTPNFTPKDIDANGAWGNVVKSLEES